MHCIITYNEELIKRAKRLGDEVIKVESSIVIKNKEVKKHYNITSDIIDNFLSAFPNIVMETVGTRALKYILNHNLGCKKDLYNKVYPKLARKFKSSQEGIARAIMGVYCKCITNMPAKYEYFFAKYECSVHWTFEYSYDFVKACQEYINENYDSLCKKQVSSKDVKEFLDAFICISQKTLGYKCLKHILENQIECNLETREKVYKVLANKFDTIPSGVANSITNIYTSVMRSRYTPEKFREFYNKLRGDNLKSIGECSIELVQIMQRYLEQN